MDGKRSLRQLADDLGPEIGAPLPESKLREYYSAIEFLAEYGYLEARYTLSIGRRDITEALQAAGVRQGDLVLAHTSLSGCGHVEGGAGAVLEALLDAVGPDGTLLLPTFTRSFFYFEGEGLRDLRARPFSKELNELWVGKIPRAFLRREGVVRTAHPSHSVAGVGPLAHACLDEHREDDPPASRNSPFGKLLDYGGKMVFLGTGLACATFLHFLEDECRFPYLSGAACRVRDAQGIRTVWVPRHLPGHRDFYRGDAQHSKIYTRLLGEGLRIGRAALGIGEIACIDARQMYELGMKALQKESTLLLCDSPACRFCTRWRIISSAEE